MAVAAVNVLGVAGLAAWKVIQSPALLMGSLFLMLVGGALLALEIILKREEYVSRGDGGAWGYLTGFQAIMSGLAHLVLAMSLLGLAGLWLMRGTEGFRSFVGGYPGLLLMLAGLWMFLTYIGVVFGQALSGVGHWPEGRVDGLIQAFNALLEKGISVILCLAGAFLAVWGGTSLLSGQGPLELLLGWL